MRKLASIQVVDDINPIPNADRIERLSVMGWQCVGEKGVYNVGDKVVYFEVDSLLPDRPEFEFMRAHKFRVKTIKLRGQISQGLCFPLEKLGLDPDLEVGTEVTEELDVMKYIPPAAGIGNSDFIGARPGYVPKTDEDRIQSNIGLLEEMQGLKVYITTKIDGTSCTVHHLDDEKGVSTRSNELAEADNVYWRAVKHRNILDWLPNGFAVQGEVAGPGIQKNRLGLDAVDFFCFQVRDIKAGRYLDFEDFVKFCGDYKLPTVPIDETNVLFDFTLEQLLEKAKGKYPESRRHREGIVIRPMVETFSQVLGGRMSFKVINNDFLLKEED